MGITFENLQISRKSITGRWPWFPLVRSSLPLPFRFGAIAVVGIGTVGGISSFTSESRAASMDVSCPKKSSPSSCHIARIMLPACPWSSPLVGVETPGFRKELTIASSSSSGRRLASSLVLALSLDCLLPTARSVRQSSHCCQAIHCKLKRLTRTMSTIHSFDKI